MNGRKFRLATLVVMISTVMPSCALQPDEFGPSGNAKSLVAYFSATGNTRAVAVRIAELTGADIYEIQPQRPYADNPYDDSDLIQSEAYNDLRPGVAGLPSGDVIDWYDTIYVGTPIWWHQPAMVVCTFLEAYDLSGKVVVPFVTYGATTYLNETMQKLYKCTPNSIHIPETLPEDIDPDNIRQPQNDDSGIDVPNRASEVEDWLRNIGALPPDVPAGIGDIRSDAGSFSVYGSDGRIDVSVTSPADLAVYDLTGRLSYTAFVADERSVSVHGGSYIVRILSSGRVSSQKIVVF